MSLGFSVEALVPAGRSGGPLRMGLTRVAETEWLQPDFDRDARDAIFAKYPDSVRMLPHADAAAREAARLVASVDDLANAAVRIWEDLCVLQDDGTGTYRLTAAALGFPTDWYVAQKMGLPLIGIHAPIHGYAEQLAAGVDNFFRNLTSGPIFGRANWFVVPTDALRYLPTDDPADRFRHVTADNAGETLFVRCERQTLRRLPETGAVLFTIGIAVAPLGTLSAPAVARVAAGVSRLNDGEHERRAAPHYADAILSYSARREQSSAEQAL